MPRALLLSLLSHQFLLLKEVGFRERYPHGWLVWEAGAWNVPDAGEELGVTRFPIHEVSDCLPDSDVLCFELVPGKAPLTLGRAPENSLVITDATVSREHLVLHPEGPGWSAELIDGAADSSAGGEGLIPGTRLSLREGVQLQLGDVRLTYHPLDSFLSRVRSHAESLARAAVASRKTVAQGEVH